MKIAHGIDIVDVVNFRRLMEKNGDKLKARIGTAQEIAYCEKQKDPVLSLAARFAAKEAVSKALGTGIGASAQFKEIEVTRDAQTGAPHLVLHGTTAATAEAQQLTRWEISLSHTEVSAIASVIAYTA